MRHLALVVVLGVTAMMMVAGRAHATVTVSFADGTMSVIGDDGADGISVSYSAFGSSYGVFGSAAGDVIPGPGCQQSATPSPPSSVTCPASVTHIDVALGGGDDSARVSTQSGAPVSVTAHGGPGNDGLSLSNSPAAGAEVFGDDGDDTLGGYLSLPATLDGGAGNDRIEWQAASGVAITVNGGPGDDFIDAHLGRGPDTIASGGGGDTIYARDNKGDPDAISCGPEALQALRTDPIDHLDASCKIASPAAVLTSPVPKTISLAKLKQKAFILPFSCATSCRLAIELVIPSKVARHLHIGQTIANGSSALPQPGTGTVTFVLARGVASKLRSLRGVSVRLTVHTAGHVRPGGQAQLRR